MYELNSYALMLQILFIPTGSQSAAMYVKGSNAFFFGESCHLLFTFAIDDPPKSRSGSSTLDINDLIVDLFNGCKTANLRMGSLVPHSVPLMATNFNLSNDQRCFDNNASQTLLIGTMQHYSHMQILIMLSSAFYDYSTYFRCMM